MKCAECGRIVRKVNGALVEHGCGRPDTRIIVRSRKRSAAARERARERQNQLYIDTGYASWDDR